MTPESAGQDRAVCPTCGDAIRPLDRPDLWYCETCKVPRLLVEEPAEWVNECWEVAQRGGVVRKELTDDEQYETLTESGGLNSALGFVAEYFPGVIAFAARYIQTLTIERDEARRLYLEACRMGSGHARVAELEREVSTLRAALAGLREALAPFATFRVGLDTITGDDWAKALSDLARAFGGSSSSSSSTTPETTPVNEKGEAEAKRVMNEIFGEGYMEHCEEARKNRQ